MITHDLLVLLNVIARVSEKAGQLVRLIYDSWKLQWFQDPDLVQPSWCQRYLLAYISGLRLGTHSSLLKHKTTRPMFDGFPQFTPQI